MRAILVLLTLALPAVAQTLTFMKSFPGSVPPYVEINLQPDGKGEYKEDPKDENPVGFTLPKEDMDVLFGLAAKLDHFSRTLESGLKVANMGAKTFRWQEASKKQDAVFNYTEDPDGKVLWDWFERIADSERAHIDLERTVKFDKLGVQAAILRVEVLRDEKRWTAPQQYLPLLDRVAKNESYLHMARTRAAALADEIRKIKTQ